MMSSYKIEIYYNGRKVKHKLYNREKTYNCWWEQRVDEAEFYKKINLEYGLIGYVDGVVDRTFGVVPDKE